MLNSTQSSEDNKKENKRKAHASVFDRSEGTGSPAGGENGYKGENGDLIFGEPVCLGTFVILDGYVQVSVL